MANARIGYAMDRFLPYIIGGVFGRKAHSMLTSVAARRREIKCRRGPPGLPRVIATPARDHVSGACET
jgi:hypothetical protein